MFCVFVKTSVSFYLYINNIRHKDMENDIGSKTKTKKLFFIF